jgi:hypothetical protein
MSTEFGSKINKLIQLQPPGVVLTSSWLKKQGYSPELLRNYRNNHWLVAIGNGAMIRNNDTVGYLGAICALQQQLQMNVHPAAKTALSLLGKTHYLELNANKAILFGNSNEAMPTWFNNKKWEVEIRYLTSSFLPKEKGLVEYEHKSFKIKISSAARALMECLYLVPLEQGFLECYELMQGLTNLSPATTQDLLESCTSVKVNRLFLYLAEKSEHAWFNHLDVNRIDLGRGNRSLVRKGVYISKYKITVPKELEADEYPRL